MTVKIKPPSKPAAGLTAQVNTVAFHTLGIYLYSTVDSDESEDEYTENSVILTFTLAPSSPI